VRDRFCLNLCGSSEVWEPHILRSSVDLCCNDRPTDTSHWCCFVIHSRYSYTLLIFCRNDTTFAELKVCNEQGNTQAFKLFINFFSCRVEYQVCPCDVCVVNRVALGRGFLRVLRFSLSVSFRQCYLLFFLFCKDRAFLNEFV
jgi:hypothetical protein